MYWWMCYYNKKEKEYKNKVTTRHPFEEIDDLNRYVSVSHNYTLINYKKITEEEYNLYEKSIHI